jgi:hypothetical protein
LVFGLWSLFFSIWSWSLLFALVFQSPRRQVSLLWTNNSPSSTNSVEINATSLGLLSSSVFGLGLRVLSLDL